MAKFNIIPVDPVPLSEEDQRLALTVGQTLASFLEGAEEPVTLHLSRTETGETVEMAVPVAALHLVAQVLLLLGEGMPFTLTSSTP